MDYENMELHELGARKNALDILLNSTLAQTVDSLEIKLNALVAAQNQTTLQRYESGLTSITERMSQGDSADGMLLRTMAVTDIIMDTGVSHRKQWCIEGDQLAAHITGAQVEVVENGEAEGG